MVSNSISGYFEDNGCFSINGNNAPLLLEGKENVWYIKSGNVDVFSVEYSEGEIKGARIYLFSLDAGNLVFGMDLGAEFSNRALLAVGNSDTTIYKAGLTGFFEFVQNTNNLPSMALLIDKWLLALNSGIARYSDLRTDFSLEKPELTQIPVHKKMKSKKGVKWITIDSGSVTLLDSDISEFSGTVHFPVTDNLWLMSLKPVNTNIIKTDELLETHDFRRSLHFYHEQVLILEDLNIKMLRVDDFVRNKEKIKTLKKIKDDAYENISGILKENGTAEADLQTKDILWEACKLICNHLGIKLQEPQLKKNESKFELDDIARASNFNIRKIALNDGWDKIDSGPIITYTKDTKVPVVLIPDFKGKYKVIIPSENINTKLTAELCKNISDSGWTFYKPFPNKAISPFELFKFTLTSCKKELAYLFAAGVIGGLLTLFIPLITGIVIDKIIPRSDFNGLFGLGLSVCFSTFALILAQIIRSINYIRFDTKIDSVVQAAIIDRLINLPVGFFKKYSSGELAAKAGSFEALKQILSLSVINTLLFDVFMIFNLFILFYYDFILGLLATLMFALYLVFILKIGIKLKNKNHTVIQHENKLVSLVNQMLNSITKIKIAGVENHAFKLWTDKYSLKQNENYEVRKSSNLIIIMNSVFPVLAVAFIYYLFSHERFSGMSAGALISFMTAFQVFLISILQISSAAISFFMAVPLFRNSKEILDTLPEYARSGESLSELKGEIEVSHLFFSYSKDGARILSDISMKINPGEFVAIVGTSGSGKSTLLRMLLGFETPDAGSIFYDKQNIENIDKASLRRQIGTVLQNSKLFPGNIHSNIAGVSNYSVEDVINIAKVVGLEDDLRNMPMGVFTMVMEGLSTFSGGQRQKILLAKALISNPSILFLDEATSALDNEAQKVIAENFSRIQATRVVVAHRLSTIVDADRIIVLEKGKIAEQGNYDELMRLNGVFADLVRRQINE